MNFKTRDETETMNVDISRSFGKIYGEDTRRKVAKKALTSLPYSSIFVVIVTLSNNVTYRSTGFLVRPNILLVSGHCLYYKGCGISNGTIEEPSTEPAPKPPIATIVRSSVPIKFIEDEDEDTGKNQNSTHDWGLIKIDKTLDERRVLPLRIADRENIDIQTPVIIPGIPTSLINKPPNYAIYAATGNINVTDQNAILLYKLSTSVGQSGSPIVVKTKDTCYACGIHSRGDHSYGGDKYNTAIKITKDILDKISLFSK